MNFLTYLVLRFFSSPVGEGILGGILFIVLLAVSPLFLVLTPFGWVWMVYNEWKEAMAEDKDNA